MRFTTKAGALLAALGVASLSPTPASAASAVAPKAEKDTFFLDGGALGTFDAPTLALDGKDDDADIIDIRRGGGGGYRGGGYRGWGGGYRGGYRGWGGGYRGWGGYGYRGYGYRGWGGYRGWYGRGWYVPRYYGYRYWPRYYGGYGYWPRYYYYGYPTYYYFGAPSYGWYGYCPISTTVGDGIVGTLGSVATQPQEPVGAPRSIAPLPPVPLVDDETGGTFPYDGGPPPPRPQTKPAPTRTPLEPSAPGRVVSQPAVKP